MNSAALRGRPTTRRRAWAVRSALVFALVQAAALGGPGAVLAHDVNTPGGHRAEDTVVHDPAIEPALDNKTRILSAWASGTTAAAVTEDPGQVGAWGPVANWPVVGIHVALLPNGKVLAWDSVGDAATETFPVHNFTRATVYDPVTGTHTPATVDQGHNIFCAGFAHLFDGSLFIAGGNKNAALEGIVQTHLFNPVGNLWSLGPNMAAGRWYPSVTPLTNGEMLITEGGPDTPEVRRTDGTLRTLNTATLGLPLYPWLDVAPDGRVFYSGPNQTMRKLDPAGGGSWQTFSQRDGINRSYGSRAVFDIGKTLVAGGGASSNTTVVIDTNGATPQVTASPPMAFGRRQHNLTLLADGSVLATGGNRTGVSLIDMNGGVFNAERWDPATGQWTTLAAQAVTRQYHSTAVLLPDGRVLSSGGGICGTCDQVGYLAKNAEIFTPPYLFKQDGSGQLAPRPEITDAPGTVGYGTSFQITTPNATSIGKVGLIRLGSQTHSVEMEQRYVPLSFTAGDGALTASVPANMHTAVPGIYMLFIVDSAGVPSVASMVQLDPAAPPPPPPPDTTPPTDPTGLTATAASESQVDLAWTASTDNVAVAGYRVERCQGATCTGFVEVATHTATNYSDAGLLAATTYRYRVRAEDTAGNLSGYSAIQNATTPDTQAPTDPTGLSATAVSDSQINLAWTASTDNVAVTGYRVERCQGAGCSDFVQVAVPSGIFYNDTGLTASTSYSYRVRATDAAGNLSGYSSVQSATTPVAGICLRSSAVWLTGMEHGVVSRAGGGIFSSLTGTPTVDNTVARSGGYSLRIADTDSGSRVRALRSFAASSVVVTRFAVRLSSLPGVNANLAYVDSGTDLVFRYNAASQRFQLTLGGSTVTATTPVSAGTWYAIDLRYDLGASPHLGDWRVNGEAQTQVSRSAAPTTANGFGMGATANASVYTANYDDIFVGVEPAAYPLADSRVVRLVPDSMGTSFGAGNFRNDDGTAIDSNSWQRLDDVPMTSTVDYVRQQANSGTSYVEFGLQDTPETCIYEVSVVLAYHAAATSADNGRTSSLDGATETVVFNGDMSQTGLQYKTAIVTPAAFTWNQAAVNGLVARVGYSTDSSPNPYWDSIMLEAAVP